MKMRRNLSHCVGGRGASSRPLGLSALSALSALSVHLVKRVKRVNAFVRGLGTPPVSVQGAQCAISSGVGPSAGTKTEAGERTVAVGVAL